VTASTENSMGTKWLLREGWPGWLGLLFALAWLAVQIIPGRAAGVTGNDPSTYVQMAHDLAECGTVLHRFEGMREVEAAGLDPAPLAPAGYLPRNAADPTLTAPLYPVGWPLLLSLLYRLGGDAALFWILPVVALLSAGLAWWVACELLSEAFSPGTSSAVATWSLALLLTVREQIAFSLSPMSDVPAQAAGLLALALAIQAARRDSLLLAGICGLALGYGYLVRHTLLLMLIPVGWTLWRGVRQSRRVSLLCALGFGGSLVVMPELLIHHERVLGGLFKPESPDSLSFRVRLIGPTLKALIGRPESFGPPFWLFWVGAALLVALRKLRPLGMTLALWVGLFVGFHAGLAFTAPFGNVVRYNLPALPGIALVASLPLAALSDWFARRWPPYGTWTAPLLLGLIGPVALLWGHPDYHFIAYGFLDAEGREAYATLADSLPPDSVILTDDQHAGAIAMYAELAVVRPQHWSDEDLEAFLATMRSAGRPVLTLGTPAYPLDFLWGYTPEPTGLHLARPPDGGDGVVHRLP
jgi:hypothetical protein